MPKRPGHLKNIPQKYHVLGKMSEGIMLISHLPTNPYDMCVFDTSISQVYFTDRVNAFAKMGFLVA